MDRRFVSVFLKVRENPILISLLMRPKVFRLLFLIKLGCIVIYIEVHV